MLSVESKKDSVQKETPAVSAMKTVSVKRKHSRPLPLRDRRDKMTEEDLRKEVLLEGAVLLNGKARKRATNSLKESARARRVIIGILPCVKITGPNWSSNSSFNVFRHTEADGQPSQRKVFEKDLLFYRRSRSNWVACSRMQSSRNPRRLYGRARNL